MIKQKKIFLLPFIYFTTLIAYGQHDTISLYGTVSSQNNPSVTLSEEFESHDTLGKGTQLSIPIKMHSDGLSPLCSTHSGHIHSQNQMQLQSNVHKNKLHFELSGLNMRPGSSRSLLMVNKAQKKGAVLHATRKDSFDKINLGHVQLQSLQKIKGTIQYPKNFKAYNGKVPATVQIAHKPPGHNYPLSVSTAFINTSTNTFSTLLPPGSYTLFIDIEEGEDDHINGYRVTRDIRVKSAPIDLGNILVRPPIQNLVGRLTLDDFIQQFSIENQHAMYKKLNAQKVAILNDTRTVVFYFSACYCTPCFGDNKYVPDSMVNIGISTFENYFKLASENPDQLIAFGIHSDFTKAKHCPQSQQEMDEKLNSNAPHWQRLNKWHSEYSKNSNVFLLWQPAKVSQLLQINAYPTVVVFKNDPNKNNKKTLHSWYMGWNAKGYKMILSD